MANVVALYTGDTIGEAQLVAVTADPAIVARVAGLMLRENRDAKTRTSPHVEGGRRSALESVRSSFQRFPRRRKRA